MTSEDVRSHNLSKYSCVLVLRLTSSRLQRRKGMILTGLPIPSRSRLSTGRKRLPQEAKCAWGESSAYPQQTAGAGLRFDKGLALEFSVVADSEPLARVGTQIVCGLEPFVGFRFRGVHGSGKGDYERVTKRIMYVLEQRTGSTARTIQTRSGIIGVCPSITRRTTMIGSSVFVRLRVPFVESTHEYPRSIQVRCYEMRHRPAEEVPTRAMEANQRGGQLIQLLL